MIIGNNILLPYSYIFSSCLPILLKVIYGEVVIYTPVISSIWEAEIGES
jgi:hypothetical protein